MKLDFEGIKRAVIELDDTLLTLENLVSLKQILPTPEEVPLPSAAELLLMPIHAPTLPRTHSYTHAHSHTQGTLVREFTGEKSKLDRPEQFFLEVCTCACTVRACMHTCGEFKFLLCTLYFVLTSLLTRTFTRTHTHTCRWRASRTCTAEWTTGYLLALSTTGHTRYYQTSKYACLSSYTYTYLDEYLHVCVVCAPFGIFVSFPVHFIIWYAFAVLLYVFTLNLSTVDKIFFLSCSPLLSIK